MDFKFLVYLFIYLLFGMKPPSLSLSPSLWVSLLSHEGVCVVIHPYRIYWLRAPCVLSQTEAGNKRKFCGYLARVEQSGEVQKMSGHRVQFADLPSTSERKGSPKISSKISEFLFPQAMTKNRVCSLPR